MAIGQACHRDGLLPSERAAQLQLVADAQQPVWLDALAVHLDLAARAGPLSFRPRLVETGDIQPDVQSNRCILLRHGLLSTRPPFTIGAQFANEALKCSERIRLSNGSR
jgi:hypothetical protein